MERLSVWVSAGLLSAGVSAAVLAGAGVAVADDATAGTEPDSSSLTGDTQSDDSVDTEPDTEPDTAADAEPGAAAPEKPADDLASDTPKKKKRNLTARTDVVTALKPHSAPLTASAPERTVTVTADVPPAAAAVSAPEITDIGSGGAAAVAKITAQPTVSLALAAPEATAPVRAAAAPVPSLLRWLQGVADRITSGIGSIAVNSLQALEALFTGPPGLPANSTVTVRSSTILLSNGQRLKANWYYPDGDAVPDKLIVLQHGFLALGPMYSHTAANLAQTTGAIVVTPTIPSNFFGSDDSWLGGEGMAAAVAGLFVGDRLALNDSARAAGFLTRYGADAELPEKFGLAGHSLGGQLVSAAAGYLVDNGAVEDLVGVITLDGVPTGSTMAVALAKLQAYEDATGRYIPVREIGAPSNMFNSVSNVKEALNAARPGRFNGVVLSGGVHMDSMRGGNPIIQFAAYLVAGFPKPQNPPAVAQLSAQWFNDWFAGDTDNGDELVPGSTLPISTPNGTAQGVVIGRAVAPAARFVTVAV